MTEAEWLETTNIERMWSYLGRARSRKCRLYSCGCCRLGWHLIQDDRSRSAVRVDEQFADGEATRRELVAAHKIAEQVGYRSGAGAWHASHPAAREGVAWTGN